MMKALKKLKICLRTSATGEELPLFQSPPAGFSPSVKPRTKVLPTPLCLHNAGQMLHVNSAWLNL